MKLLPTSLLILAAFSLVVVAKRRRVPFTNCPSTKPSNNSGLATVKPARSKIECSIFCLNDPACLSASYCKSGDGYSCQLTEAYLDGGCSGLQADGYCTQTAVVNPCENGATFLHENRTCLCAAGFVGAYCHRRYRDCEETPGGGSLYHIQPFGTDYVFEWRCTNGFSMTETVYLVTYNYTNTWQALRNGLPIQTGTFFFLGLESLHQLTKQGRYDMYVYLTLISAGSGILWYRNVRVDSEAEGYAIHWDYLERDERPSLISSVYLDGFGGAGDASKNLNGARFGTYDNDVNDCAKTKGIGWWYNPQGCMILDFGPNGAYWPTNRGGTISNEFIDLLKVYLIHVNMYVEDDLVF